ncbi:MAG: hypothetical protein IJY70_02355 [Clostridia bacterium]|nr:hypothetical protein [Clostridia bacterium]
MKKALTRTIIIVASILIVLGATILTLSLIQQTPLKSAINGYNRVEIYDLDGQRQTDMDASEQALFNDGLDKTTYSVMQGILEGKAGGELLFKRDSAGEKITVDGSTDAIHSVSVSGAYKVEFIFNADKTVSVEGSSISYDRIIVFVYDTVNEIKDLDIYFYDDDKVNLQGSEDEYDIYAVQVRAKTTDLFNALAQIVA